MPEFDTSNVDVIDVNEGSPFHINCKITATPQPKLSWKRDGVAVQSDSRVVVYPDGRTIQVLSARSLKCISCSSLYLTHFLALK